MPPSIFRIGLFTISIFSLAMMSACNGSGSEVPDGSDANGELQLSAQQLMDSDGALDFGSVATGSSITLSFRFVNTSQQEIRDIVATFSGNEFQFSGGSFPGTGASCPSPLPSLGECSVSVTYRPGATSGSGQSASRLHVEYTQGTYDKASFFQDYAASHKSFDVSLVASYYTPVAPQAHLVIETSGDFNFGTQVIGSVTNQGFTLHNVGTATATNIVAPVFGSPLLGYLAGNCGVTLAAGDSCSFVVSFAPVGEGLNLTVTADRTGLFSYDDGNGGSDSASLHVLGVGKSHAFLSVLAAAVFGNQSVGATVTRTATLNNGGALAATGVTYGAFSDGAFAVVSGGTCGTTIAAGETCTVAVTFTAPSLGAFSGSSLVSYQNRIGAATASIGASGTGATEASLAITPVASADYDDTYVGDFRTQQFTVTNQGQLPASSISGSIPETEFTFEGGYQGESCTGTLAAGASCTFSVRFTPTDHGSFSGNPQVAYSDSQGNALSATIALTGWAVKAGDLDRHFGVAGSFFYSFGGYDDEIQASVAQPDGKILLAGYSYNLVSRDFLIARLNSDGTLDTTFFDPSTSPVPGAVITHFGTNDAEIQALALQTVGGVTKIVVAGYLFNSTSLKDFAVARYSLDGVLDASFGVGGVQTTDFNNRADIANAIAIQNDGKIVVVGQARGGGGITRFAVARFTVDGQPDTTFGDLKHGVPTGHAVTDVDTFGSQAYAVTLVPGSEEIVLAGESYVDPFTMHFALAKFSTSGVLVPSFGNAGVVSQGIRCGCAGFVGDTARGVVIIPSGADAGKIVAGGFSFGANGNPNRADYALARFNADGSLDNSSGFGDNGHGKVIDSLGSGNDKAFSLLLQSDLKIVLGGRRGLAGSGDFSINRYDSNGTRDASFGNNGIVITDVSFGLPGADDKGSTLLMVNKNGRDRLVVSGFSDFSATGGSTQVGAVMVYQ